MKERPILFSTEMVRAILDGRKTQTRRTVSEKIMDRYYEYDDLANSVGKCDGFSRMWEKEYLMLHCPYEVGMILWVKETFTVLDWNIDRDIHIMYQDATTQIKTLNIFEFNKFLAWQQKEGKKSSLFMFKSLSRLRLEITDIRAERLQDITEEDAMAEGYASDGDESARIWFSMLWDKINGPDSWDTNPYVCVISFTKFTP